MARRSVKTFGVRCTTALAATTLLGACSHLHWPFHRRPPPPPEIAHELVVVPAAQPVAGSADIPQYWKRNTLVLDMRAVSGSGSVELKPRDSTTWPVRLALRVQPGTVGQFEVRADQRVIIPVVGGGSHPLDLELPPGVYGPSTSQLSLAWGPAGSP